MNKADKCYIDLLNDIMENGVEKKTRAGDVLSVFGRQLRFDLKEGFPLLTTKKVFMKGITYELLWFLQRPYNSHGSMNIEYLVRNGVHIWDDDAYRHYKSLIKKHNSLTNALDNDIKVALNKDEFIKKVSEEGFEDLLYSPDGYRMRYIYGDLGPVYGKQWRRFGNSGVDQIKKIIDTLKTNPNDRRLLCVAFNPSDLDEMALPPCHVMFQFYVRKLNDGKYGLSCKWTQRSVDSFLGLPFNIASYAALTHMIAEVVGMVPDELIADLGDTHIYCNQMKAVDEQLTRKGFDTLPTLKFGRKIDDIDDFKYEDFIIENYKSDSTIKAPLSVG